MSVTISGTTITVGGTNQTVPTVAGTAWSGNLLGAGRAVATTYTNSTGRMLMVNVAGDNLPGNGSIIGVVNGQTVNCNGYGRGWGVTFVIHPGGTYSFTNNNARVLYWYEM